MNRVSINNFFSVYIKSYDTVVSLSVAILLYIILPEFVKGSFASSFYNIGITVLSIIFSLFFAALAIIMSSTDNDFILYLEEDKHFTGLMGTFRLVLIMLFLSLIYSIVLYTVTDFYMKEYDGKLQQHKIFFIIFQLLFTYSLIATASSIKDTIQFTSFRTRFLLKKEEKRKKEESK